MKTSPTTPRTPRKTTSTAAKAVAPATREKKVAAPRARRAAPKKTAPTAVPTVSTDDVRFRAYEIYQSRNGQGDELSDWLQAERELTAR